MKDKWRIVISMYRVLKIEPHVLRIFLEDNACPLTSVSVIMMQDESTVTNCIKLLWIYDLLYAYVHQCPMMSYIVHLCEVGDLVNANPSECCWWMNWSLHKCEAATHSGLKTYGQPGRQRLPKKCHHRMVHCNCIPCVILNHKKWQSSWEVNP